jgi:Putative amidase domain/S-layer homology domain
MKHNLQNTKAVRYIGIALLVLILALISVRLASATPPGDSIGNTQISQAAIADYLSAQANPVLSDEEKIKAAINTYFTTRYEGQKSLVKQDFSAMLEDDTLDWVKKEQNKREIELYIATLFDLSYVKYNFTLDYDSMEVRDNEAVVRLRESHTVVFSALSPDESMLYNLPHTITLHDNKGKWVIYQDEYQDELSSQLKHMSVEEIKKVVDENFKNEQMVSTPSIEESVASLSLTNYTDYNRTAAVNYANAFSSSYNTNWYQTEYDNNLHEYVDCANYVSQAIYAGIWKAPVDKSGMPSGWWYDFNDPKGTQNGTRSTSWVNVVDQYAFITTNTGIGPYGYESTNLCLVSPGDIVQLKDASPDFPGWDHDGIIVWKSTTGPCSSLSSYKVNAHDIDRYQYPLSFWGNLQMRYVIISGYRLDTTPASTFSDVPKSSWAWQDIQRLYAAGFTAGCATNPLRYCPTNNVTRAEMAVFLERGIHGSSYTPPPATGTIFTDVPASYWAANWIEQLYHDGITSGCGGSYYCPEMSVTQAQMAVFLLRSYYNSSYTPPFANYQTYFNDVQQSYWAADWIKQLAREGFSYGAYNCAYGNFCPDQAITRSEMASMLVRTFVNFLP